MEPISSIVPYMVVPGNHEVDMRDSGRENSTIYTKRFMMPGRSMYICHLALSKLGIVYLIISGNERYYSFGLGMVHFVAVSTDESIDPDSLQGRWLDVSLLYTR